MGPAALILPYASAVQTFTVRPAAGSLFMGIVSSVLIGVISTAGVLWVLDRFTAMLASQALLPAMGVGAAALIGTLLGVLRLPKLVEVDDRVLRITPYVGVPREFDRYQHRFGAQVTYNNNQVQGRSVRVFSPDGSEEQIRLALDGEGFDRLMRILTGQSDPSGAAAPVVSGARPSEPLQFAPRSYTLKRTAPFVVAWVYFGFGAAFTALVAFLLVFAEAPAWAYLSLALPAGLFGGFGAMFLTRASRLVAAITVTPTTVTFDGRTFAYQDLYAMELPAPGLSRSATVKVMDTAGRKTTFVLSRNNPKAFREYDEFADLLFHAANAVKPVASYSYAGG